MNKEKVLEIKITKINDDWSVGEIVYQNTDILRRGTFYDDELNISSHKQPDLKTNKLYIWGEREYADNEIFRIPNFRIEFLVERIEKLNEKYGVKKRWKAIKECEYYYIDKSDITYQLDIFCTIEYNTERDQENYTIGNYFKTYEEAEEKLIKIKAILKGE